MKGIICNIDLRDARWMCRGTELSYTSCRADWSELTLINKSTHVMHKKLSILTMCGARCIYLINVLWDLRLSRIYFFHGFFTCCIRMYYIHDQLFSSNYLSNRSSAPRSLSRSKTWSSNIPNPLTQRFSTGVKFTSREEFWVFRCKLWPQ